MTPKQILDDVRDALMNAKGIYELLGEIVPQSAVPGLARCEKTRAAALAKMDALEITEGHLMVPCEDQWIFDVLRPDDNLTPDAVVLTVKGDT